MSSVSRNLYLSALNHANSRLMLIIIRFGNPYKFIIFHYLIKCIRASALRGGAAIRADINIVNGRTIIVIADKANDRGHAAHFKDSAP